MGLDFFLVLRWWGTLFLVGAVAFPLTKRLFAGWYDSGYFFAKAVGMATITFFVYLLGRFHLVPFWEGSIVISMTVVFLVGLALNSLSSRPASRDPVNKNGFRVKPGMTKVVLLVFLEEVFFFAALLFWAWVKGHEPSIHGLEKFMDYGFTKSILQSAYFPAVDMWYPPYPINYYYFGHTVLALLTKLSGIDLVYTFNLMLATLFGLTATMSFSIGAQLFRLSTLHGQKNNELGIKNHGKTSIIHNSFFMLLSGTLTAFLVALAGNMQTLYAFTQGYSGDDVKPFWQLLWPVAEFWKKLPEGLQTYWYANATRFIPYTIHEFPSYSFVVSDLHGHVLSLPFVLLAIALLIAMFGGSTQTRENHESGIMNHGVLQLGFYGALCGILLMTNALDGPIYFGLFLVLFIIHNSQFIIQWRNHWKQIGLMIGLPTIAVVLASLPFLTHFESFVTGIGVNCPPTFLENTKVALFLFEGVEKCQHSPLWMLWLLWGFFWFTGGWFVLSRFKIQDLRYKNRSKIRYMFSKFTQLDILLTIFFVYSLLLIIFPEFFYFKDIYPQHFRSNTMFKLGYQAFIMFSIVAGYSIVQKVSELNGKVRTRIVAIVFFMLLAPQLFLIAIFPLFSVRSYFNSLKMYEGLDGIAWIMRQYPHDYAAIRWLDAETGDRRQETCSMFPLSLVACPLSPVILEADGDSYTDYARFSAFTGLPTVIGWPVHEWLWRGSYDVVVPRREDVRILYESDDLDKTKQLLAQYDVRYVVVGTLERQKFTSLQEAKFMTLGAPVFTQGDTTIYIMKE